MCWRFNFEKISVTYKSSVYCANELPESLNAKEWWAEKLRSEILRSCVELREHAHHHDLKYSVLVSVQPCELTKLPAAAPKHGSFPTHSSKLVNNNLHHQQDILPNPSGEIERYPESEAGPLPRWRVCMPSTGYRLVCAQAAQTFWEECQLTLTWENRLLDHCP